MLFIRASEHDEFKSELRSFDPAAPAAPEGYKVWRVRTAWASGPGGLVSPRRTGANAGSVRRAPLKSFSDRDAF